MIKISVIMPVYKESLNELKESINSIKNQSYKNFEFIIVDDNPKSMIIKSFLLRISKNDSRVRIIFNKKNMGSMISANKAIRYSSGAFIARMDADDIADVNRLKYQLYFCLKNHLDISTCGIYSIVNKNIKNHFNYITQINQYKLKHLISNMATINMLVEGPTLFFNKNAVDKIGGYRNILVEDCDLVIRMIVNNYKFGYLSKPLVYKRYRHNSLSNGNTLKVFIITYLITRCIRKNNFTNNLPTPYIYKKVSEISDNDYTLYSKFVKQSLLFKHKRRCINLLKKYILACSSKLIFKRNIYMLKCKLINDFLKLFYKMRR